jgi:hypothetical protein
MNRDSFHRNEGFRDSFLRDEGVQRLITPRRGSSEARYAAMKEVESTRRGYAVRLKIHEYIVPRFMATRLLWFRIRSGGMGSR